MFSDILNIKSAKPKARNLRIRRKEIRIKLKRCANVAITLFTLLVCIYTYKIFADRDLPGEISDKIYDITANAGFKLDKIDVSGMQTIDSNDIDNILVDFINKPIFSLRVNNIAKKLSDIDAIENIHVARILPDEINIRIVERKHVAVFYDTDNHNKASLVDAGGNKFSNIKTFREITSMRQNHFPKIYGNDDSLQYFSHLFGWLQEYPTLLKHVTSLRRIGNRRWNMMLSGNVLVKLPEQQLARALSDLDDLVNGNKLPKNNIKNLDYIDMRLGDRIYIKPRISKRG